MQGRRKAIIGPLLAAILPIALFEWFRSNQAADMTMRTPHGHFVVVTIVAGLAAVVAVAVGIAGQRLRNIKVGFMSLAYLSLAGVFFLHGLTTPGFVTHSYELPAMFAQLSVLLASLWLAMSSVSTDQWLVRAIAGRRQWLLPVWLLALLLLGAYTVYVPNHMGMVPLEDKPYKWLAVGMTMAACAWTFYRYWRSYLHAGFPLQKAIVYSVSLIIAAQYIIVEGTTWRISWWLYHLLLLSAMLVMVAGLIRQYFSQGSFSSSLRVLFQSDPRAWLEACKTPSVEALIMATEAKDAYTAGHNNRVALYALRLGEEMGLSKDKLRAIAQGGVVHDVGKLKVPDTILNKAGKLTMEERHIIEQHPVSGYDMCKQLGFLGDELAVIRSHHEKWDGTGYPDRLRGEEIPLLARITAVADVYDALTSSRSYRQAMSHEEAMAILTGGSGVHFCPSCVKAWQRLAATDAEFIDEIASSSRTLRLVHKAVQ